MLERLAKKKKKGNMYHLEALTANQLLVKHLGTCLPISASSAVSVCFSHLVDHGEATASKTHCKERRVAAAARCAASGSAPGRSCGPAAI